MKVLAMALGLTIIGSTTSAYASPGGLDGSGGHHCWTNCGKYGLETGEYHFHNNWKEVNGTWYFYESDGTKVTGWKEINNNWYYFYGNGQMAANTTIDGYTLGADGKMQTAQVKNGWQQNGSVWNYYVNGIKQTGWQSLGGVWYYFNASGAMQTGWQSLGGTWYYFNASGAMQTGWQSLGGTWYYFNASGGMQTGWQSLGGTWYYFNTSGAMQTGWQSLGGTWYYFSANGAMQTGWQLLGGAWYYFNTSGAMQTGWIQDNGQWYFLESDGVWNSIVQYEGYWTDVQVPDTDDLKGVPAHMSAYIEKLSGNQVSVGVAYASAGFAHYADAGDEVTLQNNKAVLHFDEDGWGNSGTVVFEFKDGAVYVDISLYGEKYEGGFGLPEGKFKLMYHSDLE